MTKAAESSKIKGLRLAAEATVRAKNGLFVEAIDLLSEAIKIDSSDYRYFNNRCWCYYKIIDVVNSYQDAQEAIKLDPFKWRGYFNRGRALVGLRKYTEAERSFLTAKHLAADDSSHDFDEEIRKVKYLESIKVHMDPDSSSNVDICKNKTIYERDQDSFLSNFWSQTKLS